MVKFKQADLDVTFAALADPSRRAMLAQLAAQGSLSAGELGKPFAISLPAVLKHIDVLSRAGLIRREKIGRTVRCTLEANPMREAMVWLERYERFWSERLDNLALYLESETEQPSATSSSNDGAAKPEEQVP